MEIAKTLKFTLLQKSEIYTELQDFKNVVNRAIEGTCIHTNGELGEVALQ